MIEKKVNELIEQKVNDLGVIIDKIEYVKEDGNYFLRVIIDRDEIVDIDICVEVAKLINPILDKTEIIKDSYVLDVCSKERGDSNG